MPYVLDTSTSRERPRAASHAASTRRMMGAMLASVKWLVRIVMVIITNRESIMPSRHSSEDIRCDRYINIPIRETVNASVVLM